MEVSENEINRKMFITILYCQKANTINIVLQYFELDFVKDIIINQMILKYT